MSRLRDELENVKNYMKIQEYRFRGRFHLEIEVGEDDVNVYDCYVPRLHSATYSRKCNLSWS